MANSQAISAKVSGDYREYSRFRETRAGDPVRSPLRAEGSSRRTDKLQQMIRADVTKIDSLSGSGRPPAAAITTGRERKPSAGPQFAGLRIEPPLVRFPKSLCHVGL
jgi:hypothetical protein